MSKGKKHDDGDDKDKDKGKKHKKHKSSKRSFNAYPDTVIAGDKVWVEGTGCKKHASVKIKFDGETVKRTYADKNGTFDEGLRIPRHTKGGRHILSGKCEGRDLGSDGIKVGVALPRRDHVVASFRLLEHQPLRLDVLLGVAPVADGVEVAEVQRVLDAGGDPRHRTGDLAGDKRLAAPRVSWLNRMPLVACRPYASR